RCSFDERVDGIPLRLCHLPGRGALSAGVDRVPPPRGRGALLPVQQPEPRRSPRGARSLYRGGHRHADRLARGARADERLRALPRDVRGRFPLIVFLDLDEFLFSPTKTAVSEILAEFEDAPGVVVNWAVFGPADHATPPAGLLIENYTRRTDDPDFNHMVKSIVDPRRVETAPGPHYFTYLGGALAVDENGDPVQARNVTDQVSFSRLRINHYVTRSREEYERKQAILNAHTRTLKVPIKNYERRYEKLNEMQCDAIHVYLEDLRRVLANDPRGSRVS